MTPCGETQDRVVEAMGYPANQKSAEHPEDGRAANRSENNQENLAHCHLSNVFEQYTPIRGNGKRGDA